MPIVDLGRVIGQDGKNGVGVPAGGAPGQVLAKVTEKDYETGWVDPPAGGSPVGGAPRNLLDNSDFTFPVNQRKQTIYATNKGYTIDRWAIGIWSENPQLQVTGDGAVLVNTNGKNATLYQFISRERFAVGNVYTFAVKLANEVVLLKTFTMSESNAYNASAEFDGVSLATGDTGNTVRFQITITCESATFKWAALYEGEYTVDTLPMYQSRVYVTELNECRRYFQPYAEYCLYCYHDGYTTGVNIAQMRIAPTVSVTTTTAASGVALQELAAPNAVYTNEIHYFSNPEFVKGSYYRIGFSASADL